ncbi:MAG: nuclear transport factor 2 family protein [Bacteroidota bacterium]
MKWMSLFSLALLGSVGTLRAQQATNLQEVIEQYNQGGATNNVEMLQPVLAESFRVVLNDQKEEVIKVLDRATYLDLVGKKIFGGEARTLDFSSIDAQGALTATVTVSQKGAENTFRNYLSLVQNQGQWQIVQALVYID